MSTFIPSHHSYGNVYGADELVTIEEQFVDPRQAVLNSYGMFIAEANEVDEIEAERPAPTMAENVWTWSGWIARPVAAGMSYQKNQSLLWAALNFAFFPRAYVVYRVVSDRM
jgi:hypothetical protein